MNVTEAYNAMKLALEEINNPISFMRKRAEADGCVLDGQMAMAFANDANYLRAIARDILNQIKSE